MRPEGPGPTCERVCTFVHGEHCENPDVLAFGHGGHAVHGAHAALERVREQVQRQRRGEGGQRRRAGAHERPRRPAERWLEGLPERAAQPVLRQQPPVARCHEAHQRDAGRREHHLHPGRWHCPTCRIAAVRCLTRGPVQRQSTGRLRGADQAPAAPAGGGSRALTAWAVQSRMHAHSQRRRGAVPAAARSEAAAWSGR